MRSACGGMGMSMQVSVCVGEYAAAPYCIPGLGVNVYCMEELCYCIKENAFLLDSSMMGDELPEWISRECGLRDLSKVLWPLIHKKGSFSAFVTVLLEYVGFYDRQTISEVEQMLKRGAGLSCIEKKKSQIDQLVKKKKYLAAVRGYDSLIRKWAEQTREGEPLPAVDCLAAIWHNKGVALTGLMIYTRAAECFLTAYETTEREDYYRDYLAAKRMELSEADYVTFASEHAGDYELALELEKDVERLVGEWEKQPEYLLLYNRRELRSGDNRQKYFDENGRLAQLLKDSYRSSVAD